MGAHVGQRKEHGPVVAVVLDDDTGATQLAQYRRQLQVCSEDMLRILAEVQRQRLIDEGGAHSLAQHVYRPIAHLLHEEL